MGQTWRWYAWGAVFAVLFATLVPAGAADLAREREARAMLAEGEKLNEATDPSGALGIFERVIREYPGTDAYSFAQFRRAETLVFLGQCTEGIECARSLIDSNPDPLVAAWAQYAIGQGFLKQGDIPKAIQAYRKVETRLRSKLDMCPLEAARRALADLIGTDELHRTRFLGADASNTKAWAEWYAITAFRWGELGRIDLANPALARLSAECPGEKDELEWASAEVGIGYLSLHKEGGLFSDLAISLLKPAFSSAGPNDTAAKAALCLARYYCRSGKHAEAAEVLKAAVEKHVETFRGAEMLYELACILRNQGQDDAASAALKRLVEEKPFSGYATVAGTLTDEIAKKAAYASISLECLIKEADDRFDPKWKELTLAPKDGSLGDPVIMARQAVALAREDKPELAVGIVDGMASKISASAADVECAKWRLALCALRATADTGKLSHEAAFVFFHVKHDPQIQRLMSPFLEEAGDIIAEYLRQYPTADARAQAATWLDWLGEAYRKLGDHKAAIKAFKSEVRLCYRDTESQAGATYQLGLCYHEIKFYNSARRCMDRVIGLCPDSRWAEKARGAIYVWDNYGSNVRVED